LTDTANGPRDIGNLAADVEAWVARPRFYTVDVPQAAFAAGATVGSLVIPAQPLACRIILTFLGKGGFQGTAAAYGLTPSASAGTLTNLVTTVGAVVADWTAYAWRGRLDIAAATATTVTFINASTASTWFSGQLEAEIRYAGEYA